VVPVLDFTSALYLGLRHPSGSLRAWSALTTGKPIVLETPAGASGLARQLAALQGCERATLLPSTLHLFWDLFGLLAGEQVRIYMDERAYKIARWGVERAAAQGVAVRTFPHHDAAAARTLIERDGQSRSRPVILTDGFCPLCGEPAPIPSLLQIVERHGGQLVLDDTQALGVLGERPCAATPFGRRGGGSLKWHGVSSLHAIAGSSLAKAFGVPIAVLAGSEALIRRFEQRSETRLHCSPPSLAALRAAEHALAMNHVQGDRRRLYVSRLVARFRAQLRQIGLAAQGGLFPVQTLDPVEGVSAETLQVRLLCRGIRTVLFRCCRGLGTRLAFLITALHRPAEIDRVIEVLDGAIVSGRPNCQRGYHEKRIRSRKQ
jgi:8-amino-7-oxononanoate synthase